MRSYCRAHVNGTGNFWSVIKTRPPKSSGVRQATVLPAPDGDCVQTRPQKCYRSVIAGVFLMTEGRHYAALFLCRPKFSKRDHSGTTEKTDWSPKR